MSPAVATTATTRRLRFVDWIAFGLGAAALALQYWWPPVLLIAAVAVFLPSALRECGWLKDTDEFTLEITRRAGFHGLLAVVGIFLLNGLLSITGVYDASAFSRDSLFAGETLRKVTVEVFLVSYLLQYWGARQGSFRLLLGAAVLTVTFIPGWLTTIQDDGIRYSGLGVTMLLAIVLAGLAFMVRARPRAGARVLIGLVVAVSAGLCWMARDPRLVVGSLSGFLQLVPLFGFTGWALWQSQRAVDA